MDFHRSCGDFGDSAVCINRWRISDAPVELAAADALRLAPGHLLASAGTSDAVPDPLRWIWMARFQPRRIPGSHERPLQKHDPGRAGKIPATHARTLRLRPAQR